MKKDDLIALLDAEWQKSCALLMMQVHIEDWQFEYAMDAQLDYLYWCEIAADLYMKNDDDYWSLRNLTGEFEDYL
jgi:glutathionyl-hydroquinone reductase